jgi:modulator of FtsH protease HflC
MKNIGVALIGIVVVFLVLVLSLFTVDQREYAIVFRLGEIVAVKKEPGLYFKLPIIDDVEYFENRIVTLDWDDPAKLPTIEGKYMMVDSFVKWRIVDPVKYYVSTKGTGVEPEAAAEDRISKDINSELRDEFSKRTVHEVVAGERIKIMADVRKVVNSKANEMGIEIVDVRLKRVDYSDEISDSVYNRMISERKQTANLLRSEGSAASEKIRADADKQREVIIAEAFRDAQKAKGEGDAKAAEIYSSAYGKNPEFYAFYRSQEAYKNSFKSKSDVMVLDPSSEFFKYMRGAGGK